MHCDWYGLTQSFLGDTKRRRYCSFLCNCIHPFIRRSQYSSLLVIILWLGEKKEDGVAPALMNERLSEWMNEMPSTDDGDDAPPPTDDDDSQFHVLVKWRGRKLLIRLLLIWTKNVTEGETPPQPFPGWHGRCLPSHYEPPSTPSSDMHTIIDNNSVVVPPTPADIDSQALH